MCEEQGDVWHLDHFKWLQSVSQSLNSAAASFPHSRNKLLPSLLRCWVKTFEEIVFLGAADWSFLLIYSAPVLDWCLPLWFGWKDSQWVILIRTFLGHESAKSHNTSATWPLQILWEQENMSSPPFTQRTQLRLALSPFTPPNPRFLFSRKIIFGSSKIFMSQSYHWNHESYIWKAEWVSGRREDEVDRSGRKRRG